jgi:streptogramin lyase
MAAPDDFLACTFRSTGWHVWPLMNVDVYLRAMVRAAGSSHRSQTRHIGRATSMTISRWGTRFTALLTAIVAFVGTLSLTSAPAWAAAGTVTEFNVSASQVTTITAGSDGNLWFTVSGSAIGRITTRGKITLFAVPGSTPQGITSGPDGNLWFTDNAGTVAKIGRITTAGSVTEFTVPTANSRSQFITAGPDGNLWFTEDVFSSSGNTAKIDGKIGQITPAGSITEFPLPNNCPALIECGPLGITAGPDGNLWFAAVDVNAIGRITTSGSITEFPLPGNCTSTLSGSGCGPYAITAGSDGALWFTEALNKIGRITTTGSFSEFPVGGVCVANEGCGAFGITGGTDGNLWFTEGASDTTDMIGRLTPTGSFTAFPVPVDGSDGSMPRSITSGPDGNLWFTEQLAGEIGRITPS